MARCGRSSTASSRPTSQFANQHDDNSLDRLSEGIRASAEVVEFYWDYMLKIPVRDVATCDGIYERLVRLGGISDVTSSFAMEELKYTTAIPIADRAY